MGGCFCGGIGSAVCNGKRTTGGGVACNCKAAVGQRALGDGERTGQRFRCV